jgi:PAS domain S-box-containing protein
VTDASSLGRNEAITDAILAGVATISADAIICIDRSQHIIFFNSGAADIFGYTPEEALGQHIEVLIPPRFRKDHSAQVERFGRSAVRARRMGERSQISALRKNGDEFPAEAAISHLGEGENIVYSVVLRDITFRRRLERGQQFLAEAGEKLAASLGTEETIATVAELTVPELADAAIVTIFHGGAFRDVRVSHVDVKHAGALQAAREATPPELESKHPVSQVIRTGERILIADAASADPEQGAVLESVGKILEADICAALVVPLVGRDYPIGVLELYSSSRKFDHDHIVLAEDLSRRAALALDNARLHEQVMFGLAARDDMIGIVSHDLRNPVNAVKMLTGAILSSEKRAQLPADVVEYSSIIRQAAEQMDSLIRDLLDMTRVEAGRLHVDQVPTEVAEFLDDALRTLVPVASAKGIELHLAVEKDLPQARIDRERIRQAISNLIGNSVKFSPRDTIIELAAKKSDGEVLISVKDHGPGMTADHVAHAFDRFWQSKRTDREGAGLGLAITRGIVDAHGGRIWVESAVGKGSTFYFTLPTV